MTALSKRYHAYRTEVRRYTQKALRTMPWSTHPDFHVDHIVPISKGFDLNIPPELIGSRSNLRVMRGKDNWEKGSRFDASTHEKLREWGYE